MIFRLGYVAMTMDLVDCSPSGTVTFSIYDKLPNDEARIYRLRKITAKNLENTLRILRFNKAMGINVFRLTSKLVPLATHLATEGWDYTGDFSKEFKEIGVFIKENDLRVSAHPDHFTLINSPSAEVLSASIKDLDYHTRLFEAMGLEDYGYKLVIHVGGLYKDKASSIARFKENFIKLPERLRKRLIIENDDKSYTARDVLLLCKEIGAPMVLDVHHHYCANEGESLELLLPDIFGTWKYERFKPKIHFSSPKSKKDFRSHADYIELEEFIKFIRIACKVDLDFDVMLEAKSKERSLLQLSDQLSEQEGIERLEGKGQFRI